MRKFLFLRVWVICLVILTLPNYLSSQVYTIGAPSPAIGTSGSFTALVQYMLFDVLDPQGVILDSCDIYPTSGIGQPFTIVVQNSAQVVIASVSGTTTVSSGQPQRIALNLLIPQGQGYRWGFSVNPGMTRNSTGAAYPYTAPGLMVLTGNTFDPVNYYYFFYNIRVRNTASPTDAALTSINSPGSQLCNGLRPINVTLKNIGPNELVGTTLKWKVNSIEQTPYQWSGSLNVNDSTQITIGTYDFLAFTIYDLEIYSELPNGQLDSNNVNDTIRMLGISAIESPTGSVSSTGSPTICSGEPIAVDFNLTGVSPWVVTASFGSDTQIINNITNPNFSGNFTPQLTGSYVFTVTDATSCYSTLSGSVITSVNPTPNLIISNDTLICKGEDVTLSVSGGEFYAWNNGQGTAQINVSPNATTTYSVTSYNSNLTCSSNASVTVNIDGPVLNLGPDRTECAPSYILEAGNNYANYLWHNGLQTPEITLDTIGIGLGEITASVTVTTLALGCELNDTVKIQFTDCTYIDDFETNLIVKVSPNPSNGKFSIDFSPFTNTNIVISIFDALGKMIYLNKESIGVENEIREYSFENLEKGIYFINIKTESKSFTRKLIIH